MVNGKPAATHDVMQLMIFLISHSGKARAVHESEADGTLAWLCRLPLMHGVHIVARAPATKPAASKTDNSWPDYESVVLPAGILPTNSASGHARIQFCVDVQGRLSNTVVETATPDPLYGYAARRVMEQVNLSAREVSKQPVSTCGLSALVTFSGSAGKQKAGSIGRIGDVRLSGTTPVPAFKSAKPAKVALHIPVGTKLPPVAKVEVRFCIDKDGSVSEPEVIKATPARYFDQAAIETVKGWRFASSTRRLCDVYQWVKFPLSSSGH